MLTIIRSFLSSTSMKVLISKVRSRSLKLSDITCFLTGEWRYHLYCNGYSRLIRKSVMAQIEDRLKTCNQQCLANGACVHCGCSMPAKLFCADECSGGCYPKFK
jgi:hypothetical protein